MLLNDQLGIHKVNAPVQGKYAGTNCYAIRGASGWAIVDTGLNTEQNRDMWKQFISTMGIKFTDIKGIYLTHGHADHCGIAGWLQQLSGAPVYMNPLEHGTNLIMRNNWDDYFCSIRRNGMPQKIIPKVRQQLETTRPLRDPMAEITPLESGTTVYLGDFPYTVLLTPGHSGGHVCYFNEQHQVLLSGDHIIPEITPHVGLYSDDGCSDPLNDYFQSLEATRNMNCKLVLPAHGDTFSNLAQRTDEIMISRQQRMQSIKESAGANSTVFEVCIRVFGDSNLILAMADTYANLMHLVYKNELRLTENEELRLFSNL